jgi:GNAT superfamily N-acetyltransferase
MTIYFLEMKNPAELQPALCPDGDLQITRMAVKQWEVNRFLYQFAGGDWNWTDRLVWTPEQWKNCVNDADFQTWLAIRHGSLAGYYELRKEGRDVEILYFGLCPGFIGQGLGGHLLTSAIRSAWGWDAGRVWVHTCDQDHPAALKNYQRRGMTLYKTQEENR